MFRERFASSGQVIRMMVAVSLEQHLERHAEKARGLPRTRSALHQPRRSGVPQHVRSHVRAETRVSYYVRERLLDCLHRLSIPLHHETLSGFLPTTQMRQQLVREGHGRLPLVRLALSRRTTIEHTAIDIDPSVADSRL